MDRLVLQFFLRGLPLSFLSFCLNVESFPKFRRTCPSRRADFALSDCKNPQVNTNSFHFYLAPCNELYCNQTFSLSIKMGAQPWRELEL